ncbi:MAG: NAD-dependent epimerase/dehydratase family protein [Candidatus Aminicenantes bacterium]|nr:NAD-dependent epimerase/dehydratase family protein [Candidatus Aminicenantes bacterium]
MKICVTGGSGFIGSHLVQKLLDKGYEVSVLDLRKPVQDVEWLRKDIRDDLGNIFSNFNLVFHLAALANARKSSEDPKLCHDINIKGTLNVLNAALKGDVERVLLASSSWVCGAQEGDVVNERSPFHLDNINTIYGASKIGQELLCFSFYSEYKGPKYTVFRYGIPYGERMWRGLVVRAFMEMAERTGVLSIMGDGKQFREFMYVGDLAEGHLHALKPVAENKIYNLTGGRPITIEEIAKEVVKHFPAKIDYIPQARVEPKIKRVHNWLAENELGWVPRTTLEDGIRLCAEWWKTLTDEQKLEEYWC